MTGFEHVGIFGRTGCGKSHLARSRLRGRRRVVVFDPMGDYGGSGSGFRTVASVAEMADEMATDWEGFRLAYRPDVEGDMPGQLHDVARAVWRITEGYQDGRSRLPLILAVDEANTSMPATQLPAGQRGMQALILRGRHRGVSVWAISQRPALVSADFRGNMHRLIAFALPSLNDRRALGELYGPEVYQAVSGLDGRRYVEIEHGRVIYKG